jgi:hypothetical protein
MASANFDVLRYPGPRTAPTLTRVTYATARRAFASDEVVAQRMSSAVLGPGPGRGRSPGRLVALSPPG